MAKKVLIISTSLRGGSNSEILAKECEKGALAAGHDVELLSLKGKDIKFCIGCLSCQSKGTCVLKDDVAERLNKTAKEMFGVDNFTEMIADETVTTDCEELLNWLTEKGHPVLGMEPLM